MAYDDKAELARVMKYYNNDPLQKRFSAIICGGIGVGKTKVLETARMPVFVDSFDPGGSKCLMADSKWSKSDPRRITSIRTSENPQGQIIVDSTYENENPYKPTAYREWQKNVEIRIQTGFFNQFGTYAMDSLSTFADAVMNYVMLNAKGGSRAGEAPMHRRDYNPQKVEIVNRIKQLMTLPCDFFLMSHLKEIEEDTGIVRDGVAIKNTKYRLSITGNAILTVPLLFDEIYVLLGSSGAPGSPVKRELLLDAQGKYIARSRLKSKGSLKEVESPDIKSLLKKAGLSWEDKPALAL